MVNERIAIFLPSLAGGGAERSMVNLANGFRQLDRHVDLLLANASGPYRGAVEPSVRVIDLKASRVMLAIPALARYLRAERPHVLLSALDHANLAAILASQLSGSSTRIFVTARNVLSHNLRHSGRWMDRFVLRWAGRLYPRAAGIIAVSDGVRRDLVDRIGLPSDAVTVIHNPIVDDGLRALAEAEPRHPWLRVRGTPVILGVGRLVAQKDFTTLIRAFAILQRELPSRLVILGEGPERPALERLIEALGLSDSVRLPGFDENPFAAMAAAGLLVLSSAWEGLPGVLIQAMACGTPVVSTDCPGGSREILDNGRLGHLVPVGDPAAMAEAIRSTLASPTVPSLLLARADAFSVDRVSKRYLAVLSSD